MADCEVLSPSWNMWLSVPPVVGAQVVSRPPVQLDHPPVALHRTALAGPDQEHFRQRGCTGHTDSLSAVTCPPPKQGSPYFVSKYLRYLGSSQRAWADHLTVW